MIEIIENIRCDGKNCKQWLQECDRDLAQEFDWTQDEYLDFCPECTEIRFKEKRDCE